MKKTKSKTKSKKVYDTKDIKGRKFTTPKGRLSFPSLVTPEQYQNKGEFYYKTAILFDKSQDLKAMKKEINLAAAEVFGKDKSTWPDNLSLPWRDGDESSDYDGYQGRTYVSAKTKNKVVICKYVDSNNQRELVDDADEVFGGKNARLVLVAKVTESGGNYFVSLYLQAVQLLPGGEKFGGASLSEDFDDLEIDDDEDEDEDLEIDEDEDDDEEDEDDEDEDDDDEDDDEDEEEEEEEEQPKKKLKKKRK